MGQESSKSKCEGWERTKESLKQMVYRRDVDALRHTLRRRPEWTNRRLDQVILNGTRRMGRTMLSICVEVGSATIAYILLNEFNANVEGMSEESEDSKQRSRFDPLRLALTRLDVTMVCLLLSFGADVEREWIVEPGRNGRKPVTRNVKDLADDMMRTRNTFLRSAQRERLAFIHRLLHDPSRISSLRDRVVHRPLVVLFMLKMQRDATQRSNNYARAVAASAYVLFRIYFIVCGPPLNDPRASLESAHKGALVRAKELRRRCAKGISSKN